MRVCHFAVMLLLASAAAYADEPATKAGLPTLHLKIPAGWQSRTRQPAPSDKPLPTVMQIGAREPAGAFAIQLTFFANSPRKLSDDDVRKIADAAAQQYVPTSVEQKADLQELKGEDFLGYYATLTDAKPKPGGFPAVTSLVARLGDGLMAVTILHPKDSKNLPIALQMFKTATLVAGPAPAAAGAAASANIMRITAPSKKWSVVIDLPNARPADTETSDDGKATQLHTFAGDVICSAFIEPAAKPGDAKVARAFYWAKERQAPLQFSAIKLGGDDKIALLDYTADATDRNVHAYLVHDGQWVDLHLSHPAGTDADTAMLEKALKTARVEVAK